MKFLEKNIKFIQMKYPWMDLETYKKFMLYTSFFLATIFAIGAFLYYNTIDDAIIWGIGGLLLGMVGFYYYANSIRKHYIGLIEKDLPFLLMDLDIKLSIGMNFFDALESITKDYDYLGKQIKKCLNQYDKGIPLHKSFSEIGEKYDSQDFKRALNQIYAIYQSGYKGEGALFSLAEEFLNKQKAETKVYNSKLVMISLLFIGATAIVPALFLVFVTIGSSILNLGLSPLQVLLIFTILFPIIDIGIIAIIYSLMPAYMKG